MCRVIPLTEQQKEVAPDLAVGKTQCPACGEPVYVVNKYGEQGASVYDYIANHSNCDYGGTYLTNTSAGGKQNTTQNEGTPA